MSYGTKDYSQSTSPPHSTGSKTQPGKDSSSVGNSVAFGLWSARLHVPVATTHGHPPWSYIYWGSFDVGLNRVDSSTPGEMERAEDEPLASTYLRTRLPNLGGVLDLSSPVGAISFTLLGMAYSSLNRSN
ncbi:hypothetical protein Pyn_16104 [Prunus yedoensis var. nudiflora]|uniref:Uncharacterized protein n=1 Tax=Prunus yedoensis var. nudiflora TaxID=2094558 RepID=A0A314XNX1_PRUYE|nr:hypothetical protein Pyn_16104 [Prunus yedoensis var. nudiflora]